MKWFHTSMIKSIVTKLLIGFIAIYTYLISPWLGNRCRYHPNCSSYAKEALQIHGPIKGLYLAIYRLLRCAPWGKGGYDPVPTKEKK